MFIYIHIRNCFLSKPHLPIIVDSCKRRYLLREAQSEKHTSQFHYSIEKKTALSIFRRFIMQVIIATFKVKVCPHSKCTIKKKCVAEFKQCCHVAPLHTILCNPYKYPGYTKHLDFIAYFPEKYGCIYCICRTCCSLSPNDRSKHPTI